MRKGWAAHRIEGYSRAVAIRGAHYLGDQVLLLGCNDMRCPGLVQLLRQRDVYYELIVCNGLAPQLMWFRKVRTSPLGLFITAMFVNVGMWLERFVIIPTSLHRDFLPSSWGMYHGTIWDWATFVGTIGLFLSLLFLFIRFLPMISIFEMRTLVPEAEAVKEAEA